MRRSNLAALAVVAVLATLVAPSVSADSPPPTLSGVFLSAEPVSITASCNPGSTSTMSFSAIGTAYGPYPGTFTATGTVTIGGTLTGFYVNGIPLYQVTSVQTYFTIDSTVGQVTGTTQLVTPGSVSGLCNDFDTPSPYGMSLITGTFRELLPDATGFGLSYEATIETASGLYGDVGGSGLLFIQLIPTSIDPPGSVLGSDVLNHWFSSSGTSVFPISRVGHATGGGQIGSSTTFGFHAESDGGLRGGCTVIDRASGDKVKCLDVTSFNATGTHVTFWGHATVNGVTGTYRIDVHDIGEPGAGVDTFAIQVSTGFSAAGVLSQGNIQIHG
jgi:hypothetical protein